jgi:hypothetical protein
MVMQSSIKKLGQRMAAVFAACGRAMTGERSTNLLDTGDYVRVRRAARSPMPGRLGQVVGVSLNDNLGPYLVEFDGGLRFRYRHVELERVAYSSSIPTSPIQCHS